MHELVYVVPVISIYNIYKPILFRKRFCLAASATTTAKSHDLLYAFKLC